MSEIKVGSIVYSPDYGKGRVVEVHKLLGYDVADVGFAGHDQPKTINLVNLSTASPGDVIQRLTDDLDEMTRARNEDVKVIQRQTRQLKELEARNLELCTVIASDDTKITAEASTVLSLTAELEEMTRLRDEAVNALILRTPAQDALATVQAERDAYRLTLQEIKNMKVAPDVMAVTVALLQIQNAAAEALRFRP